MLEKVIKYEDFDGNKREETAYFHLSKPELIEMQVSETGGLEKVIKKITEEQDNKKLIALFKDLIVKSYGEKSLDGKRFIKNQELTDAFIQSAAYSELFMELATDSDKASEFIMGILPKDLSEQVEKELAAQNQ